MNEVDISPEAVDTWVQTHGLSPAMCEKVRAMSAALQQSQAALDRAVFRADLHESAMQQARTDLTKALAWAKEQHSTADRYAAELQQARAKTAAAIELAAQEVDCGGCNGDCPMPHTCCSDDAAAIRAIATPDQSASLDAVKAAARAEGHAEGMREAVDALIGPMWRLILRDEECIDSPCANESC